MRGSAEVRRGGSAWGFISDQVQGAGASGHSADATCTLRPFPHAPSHCLIGVGAISSPLLRIPPFNGALFWPP